MLRELRIRNLAIIDDATASFEKGLNILTGETGAGKSIIIDALCLALGERVSGEVIRSGEKEAVVEAYFDIQPKLLNPQSRQLLQDMGIHVNDGIILKRILFSQGKSRAYINDSMVNVTTLSAISSSVIDVHGQYEYQSLLSPVNQLDMLDVYGGLFPVTQEVAGLYEAQIEVKQHISGLLEKEKERAQRLDILNFQVKEIEAGQLKAGEEEELAEELKILSSASLLTERAGQAYESLYSSDSACISNLSKVRNSLKEISNVDMRAEDALKSVEEALPLLEETAYFLRDYKASLNFDPSRLEEIQSRLDLISGLKKKYGNTVQEVTQYKESGVREIEELQNSEERLESLNTELQNLKNRLTEKARQLSKKRRIVAKKIEQQVESELSKLSMPDTKFSIQILHESGEDTTDGFKASARGIDKVEYLISPNMGEELKPLSKIASGGELSRVMLALKGILAKGDKIPVLIFDEIDAGIGGRAATAVGQRLKNLSSNHQVICITHLPRIASYADTHLKIEKKVREKRTTVEIRKIEKEERTREIARMLSGDDSEVSIKHAKELLKSKMEMA